jgi:hypothetical protein
MFLAHIDCVALVCYQIFKVVCEKLVVMHFDEELTLFDAYSGNV